MYPFTLVQKNEIISIRMQMWLNGFVYFPRVLISAWLAYRYVVMIFQKRDENLEYLLEVVQPDIVCALSSLNSSWTTFCEFTIMLHRKGCDLKYFGVLVRVCHVCILQYHLFLSFLFSTHYLEISAIWQYTFMCHISCLLPTQQVFWALVLSFLSVFSFLF